MAVPDATRHARPRPWHHHPPAPSAAPGLYTSVVLRRSVDYLVDVVIIAVLSVALGFVLSLIGLLSFGLLSPLAVLVMALWPLAYHSSFVATRGATPGLALFSLELRDWDGGPVEPLQAVLVVLLFYVPVSPTALLGPVVVLLTERGRGLPDPPAAPVI